MKRLLSLLIAALGVIAPHSFAATAIGNATEYTILYRGTATLKDANGNSLRFPTLADCTMHAEGDAELRKASANYRCVLTSSFRVTYSSAPPPPPPPPPPPADTDGDGVPDSADACPTVAANTVDGCPVVVPPPPPPPPPPTASSYPWYPALDLAQIPWHNAAGPWGPAVRLQAPAAPNLTGAVVNLTGEGVAQNLYNPTPGTRYVVAANVGTVSLGGTVTDVELVIPQGFRTGVLYLNGTINRLRIRGTTIGVHSGGQVLRIDLNSQSAQDIILDGIKISGSNSAFEHSLVITGRPNRMAIVNCKIRSPRATFIGRALNMVWAGNSIQSGVITSGQAVGAAGVDEAQWTIRHDTEGPVVLFANDIRGRKYHRFRTGANTAAEAASTLHYIAKNRIVDEQESAITLVLGATSSPATIITDNDIYAYVGSGGGQRFDAEMARYARITNNRIYSNAITAAWLAGRAATHVARLPGADVDYTTGNTFAPWSPPTGWVGAGDPSDVYLAPAPILNQAWHAQDLVGLAP